MILYIQLYSSKLRTTWGKVNFANTILQKSIKEMSYLVYNSVCGPNKTAKSEHGFFLIKEKKSTLIISKY